MNNEGQGVEAIRDFVGLGQMGGKRAIISAINPALELYERLDSDSLKHSDEERFLNKPMKEQIDCMLAWFQEEDFERGLYFLAVFARDRGSPYTDWPVNHLIDRPDFLDVLVDVRRRGIMSHGLFAASLSAFAQKPSNARHLLRPDTVACLVESLEHSLESEVNTAFALKGLALLGQHQPESGKLEALLASPANQRVLPLLLTVLQDDTHKTVFESRYSSQLLSCVLRCYPGLLNTELNGKYRDSEGKPITVFRSIREGLRFRDSASIQYYLRLMQDCFVADAAASVKGFTDADLTSVLVGLLVNNWNYLEVLPPITRALTLLTHASSQPGDLLLYKDFLRAATSIVLKAGSFNHHLVVDLRELVCLAFDDPTISAELLNGRKAMLDRFLKGCDSTLGIREVGHVSQKWLDVDRQRMEEAAVLFKATSV